MDELTILADKYKTDKGSTHHNYTPIYHEYLKNYRSQPFTMLELGFGGYHHKDSGGESAKMWAEYFPHAHIIVTDIYDKDLTGFPSMVKFHKVSQNDEPGLKEILRVPPLVIIDDASHNSVLTCESFNILFPLLKSGGIYIVEDTETSYWDNDEFKGSTTILDLHKKSTMNSFKLIPDIINAANIPSLIPNLSFPDWMKEIKAIHFYQQFIVILKK